jgi:hypothetical protein
MERSLVFNSLYRYTCTKEDFYCLAFFTNSILTSRDDLINQSSFWPRHCQLCNYSIIVAMSKFTIPDKEQDPFEL